MPVSFDYISSRYNVMSKNTSISNFIRNMIEYGKMPYCFFKKTRLAVMRSGFSHTKMVSKYGGSHFYHYGSYHKFFLLYGS